MEDEPPGLTNVRTFASKRAVTVDSGKPTDASSASTNIRPIDDGGREEGVGGK